MTTPGSRVLIFVEDPGVANYVALLPTALSERGHSPVLWSAGIATDYLARRGVRQQVVAASVTADQILDAVRPRAVVVGTAENPETIGLSLIDAARAAGITSIGVIDAAMNAEGRFRGRGDAALTHPPDWLVVPDEWTKRLFVALGFPEARAAVCGHPHYDYVLDMAGSLSDTDRRRFRRRFFPGVEAGRQVVVFVAERPARRRGISPTPPFDTYTLSGRGTGAGRMEIVLEEFLDAVNAVSPRPYLVLRTHPKDAPGDYGPYLKEFDRVDGESPPLELVAAADAVVGATSMLLTEAALLGRPTLSILPRAAEKEWLPSVRAGLTRCVTERHEVATALTDLLRAAPLVRRSDPREMVVTGSLIRVGAFIESLLRVDTLATDPAIASRKALTLSPSSAAPTSFTSSSSTRIP